MGKFCNIYEPVSSVTAPRLVPVAVCVAVTSAPGRTAPDWSFTEPLIWAVACAHVIVAPNDKQANPTSILAHTLIDFRIIVLLSREKAGSCPLIVFALGGGSTITAISN